MYKLLVAGGRDFQDKELLDYWLNRWDLRKDLHIITGGARGADRLAEDWARDNGVPLTIMKAEWDRYGKSAGFRRNADMWNRADGGIIFWDGKSKGTKHSLELAAKDRKFLQVVYY